VIHASCFSTCCGSRLSEESVPDFALTRHKKFIQFSPSLSDRSLIDAAFRSFPPQKNWFLITTSSQLTIDARYILPSRSSADTRSTPVLPPLLSLSLSLQRYLLSDQPKSNSRSIDDLGPHQSLDTPSSRGFAL
jgi:hypothetical protein